MFRNELKDYYFTVENRCNTILRCINDIELNIDFIEKLGRTYKDKDKDKIVNNVKQINKLINDIKDNNYLDFKDIKGSDNNEK